MKHKFFVSFVVMTSFAATATIGFTASAAQAFSPSTEHVSTTGVDSGNCIASPCATINYAIGQAPAGTTIDVATGNYNQTVDITKPITLKGSGVSTVINGAGLDPTNNGYYGVVYVGSTGGLTTVEDFTITNPYPDAFTSGEPEAVALADQSSADAVDILDNQIIEGNSDSGSGTDFPIGIDTFLNAATTVISGNTVSGFFQGALLEDNGPANVSNNTFSGEISNTADSVVYPGEGVFFLSDEAGSLTGQNATSNTFSGYSGYGVAMDAGYTNGNCSNTPCNGSISGAINKNHFALTAGSPAAAAIALQAQNNGNGLTVTVNKDTGYVTKPSVAVSVSATGGGDVNYTENGTDIARHRA